MQTEFCSRYVITLEGKKSDAVYFYTRNLRGSVRVPDLSVDNIPFSVYLFVTSATSFLFVICCSYVRCSYFLLFIITSYLIRTAKIYTHDLETTSF